MNDKDNKLISNQREINDVYMAINDMNTPSFDKFDVLYANKYVQETPQKMVPELAEIFNSDAISLNNPNLREQVSRLMNQYDSESGPWYLDGDDSVLIIHNGTNGPDSGFVFKYQEEFGEILRVKVSHKEVYGGSAVKAMQLPDYNAQQTQVIIEPVKEDYSIDDEDSKLPKKSAPNDTFSYYSQDSILRSHLKDLAYMEDPEYKERIMRSYNNSINEYHDSMNYDPTYDNPSKYRSEDANYKRKQLDTYDPLEFKYHLENIETSGKLSDQPHSQAMRLLWDDLRANGMSSFEQNEAEQYKHGSIHQHKKETPGVKHVNTYKPNTYQWATALNEYRLTIVDQQKVDSLKMGATIPINLNNGKAMITPDMVAEAYNKATGRTETVNSRVVYSIYSDMARVQDKYIKKGYNVVGIVLKTDPVTGMNYIEPDLRKIEEFYWVSTYDSMEYIVKNSKTPNFHNAFDAAMASVNSMRNKLKRAKHKELQMELVLVGRPQLKAGIVITILGIGKRYSGKWYVKTCMHQMDKSGYTCSLTLQKNHLTAQNVRTNQTTNTKNSEGKIVSKTSGVTTLNITRSDYVYMQQLSNKIAELDKKLKDPDVKAKTKANIRDRIQDFYDMKQAVVNKALSGGTSTSWNKDGVVVNYEEVEKGRKLAKEVREKRRESILSKASAEKLKKPKRIKRIDI